LLPRDGVPYSLNSFVGTSYEAYATVHASRLKPLYAGLANAGTNKMFRAESAILTFF